MPVKIRKSKKKMGGKDHKRRFFNFQISPGSDVERGLEAISRFLAIRSDAQSARFALHRAATEMEYTAVQELDMTTKESAPTFPPQNICVEDIGTLSVPDALLRVRKVIARAREKNLNTITNRAAYEVSILWCAKELAK